MDWLSLARDFQSAIVGFVGFAGVIIAQFVNGYLLRKRDIMAEDRQRDAVTAAVKAELSFFIRLFRSVDPKAQHPEGKEPWLHRVHRPMTTALMKDLGLLKTNCLEDVLHALLTIDSVYENIELIAPSISGSHISIDLRHWTGVAKGMNEAADLLEDALNKIQ